MPFLTRQKMDPKLRTDSEKAHRAKLRQALLTPGMTAEQKAQIKAEIGQIGKPKNYEGVPPKPGAHEFETRQEVI